MSVDLFLNTLFHDKPEKDWLLLWEKHPDQKVSYWFDHVSDAVKHFNSQGLLQDTYVGCGPSTRSLPTFRRCKAEEISGIPAAWIDVDVLNPVHSKPNLPENNQKALEIIEPFPLKPTIVVHSGHGYQFWWVFDKFAKFKSEKMHEEASTLLHQFTWTMRDMARSMGYDLDMTFDLSRVFRIPGGRNFKDDPPAPITLEHCSRDFYSFAEFNNALQAFRINMGADATPIEDRKITSVKVATIVQGEKFVLDPNANPPQEKFETLRDFDTKFKASWEHRRKDFKSGDESASAYDLSLASFALGAGWTEQETVDLLIAFRRNNNLKAKLVESYYRRTLTAASNAVAVQQNFDDLAIAVENTSAENLANKTPEEKAVLKSEAQKILWKIVHIKFLRILKYKVDPAEYRLELESTCIHLGGIQNLIDQPYFKRKIADAVGVYLVGLKADKWALVAQALLNLCEEVSAGEDTSSRGLLKHWLQNFLEQYAPLYDMTEGMLTHRPFYHKDSLYISGPDLRNYIAMFWREIINPKSMGIMLKEYGFQPLSLNVKKNNSYVSRAVWKIEIAKNKIAQSFLDVDLLNNANEQALEAQLLKDKPKEDM